MAVLGFLVLGKALADLRNPAWYDVNTVGAAPDWHYRVPIAVPAGAAINSTIRLDADFNALLAQMGVSGTFDANSPRVVRPNNSLATTQEFTDRVFAGGTDPMGNGRGEVRFILQDGGPTTYYLYFDISANGAKPAWAVANTINGNFEFSTDGQQDPPGWSGTSWSSFDAFAIANQTGRTVTTDYGTPSSVITDETGFTGGFCYLLGARNSNEATDRNPSATLTRTITVPASNPGSLRLRYRVKGWDSSANGSTTYDFLQIYLQGSSTRQLVGPAANNYTTLPYSPNLGTNSATSTSSGYGPYNYWDADLNGNHRSGMTLTPGSEPWFELVADLSTIAGQSITLNIRSRNTTLYKSWFHIDDVEWSVVTGTLGSPQGFGVNIVTPNDTAVGAPTVYNVGNRLTVRVRVDAAPTASGTPVTANVVDPFGTVVATNIILYNDGTHGDATAGDAFWTNDGSVPAQPTYTFQSADFPGATWQVTASAKDGSTSTIGASDGLIHIPGQPATPFTQANYFNIDQQNFTLNTPPRFVMSKTVTTESDPTNGNLNPKAIPGATVIYTLTVENRGGAGTDSNSVVVIDPITSNLMLYVNDFGGAGPVAFTDGSTPSGLTYTFIGLGSGGDDLAFSNNNGASYGYPPVPDANGYDGAVTHIRVNPKGAFNGVSGLNVPSFTLRFRAKVK
jgi:uncharacterized repeat protein (TIGR01451 family)